jgi:anti-anti-sigma factor
MLDTTVESVSLVCDQCGVMVTAASVHDPEVVWPVVLNHGWTGSPFPTGVHLCPPCSERPDARPDVLADARAEDGPDGSGEADGAGLPWRADLDLVRGAAVLTPSGDLAADTVESLRQRLTDALRHGPHVVVDLRHGRTMDPAGLAVLVRGHREARQRGGMVCLASASRFVVTALHTMCLERVFPIFPDRDTALAWLAPTVDPSR